MVGVVNKSTLIDFLLPYTMEVKELTCIGCGRDLIKYHLFVTTDNSSL